MRSHHRNDSARNWGRVESQIRKQPWRKRTAAGWQTKCPALRKHRAKGEPRLLSQGRQVLCMWTQVVRLQGEGNLRDLQSRATECMQSSRGQGYGQTFSPPEQVVETRKG